MFFFSGCCSVGTEGVAAGFDCELAHKAKHTGTASETKSQKPEKWFSLFLFIVDTGIYW